uniref:Uncharacterized protein n=1 Tax=Phage sp. ctv3H3 TaxID=2826753 RepID=A0A8S5NBH5_9VIRU|nr:MAG TPA: hypothetical protein [Phage sp. ctv3H3]
MYRRRAKWQYRKNDVTLSNFKKSSEKFSSFLRSKNAMFCFFRNKKSHYMERYPPMRKQNAEI